MFLPVSHLFINQFTKHNNYKISFFPSQCVFQDLSIGKRIGSGHEQGGIYYLNDQVTPTCLVAGQPDPVYFGTGAWVILRCKSFGLLFLLSPLFLL